MRSCGCGYSGRYSANFFFLGGGGGGGVYSSFLSILLPSCFVFGLLSIGAALYYFLWFSRGCGRVPRSGGGSGWVPVPFVVDQVSTHTIVMHMGSLMYKVTCIIL